MKKIKIECEDAVMRRVFSGRMDYNTAVAVPAGFEAVFVRGGQIIDVLRAGEHVINERTGFSLRSAPKETCELYAVCRAKPFDVLWGVGGVPIDGKTFGASGSYRISVDNPQSILRRFGFNEALDAPTLRTMLKGAVTDAVREELNAGQRELAARIKKRLDPVMLDYGLFLDTFRIDEVRDVSAVRDDAEQEVAAVKNVTADDDDDEEDDEE